MDIKKSHVHVKLHNLKKPKPLMQWINDGMSITPLGYTLQPVQMFDDQCSCIILTCSVIRTYKSYN